MTNDNDDEHTIALVRDLAEVFDGHNHLEILKAITYFLSYMIHDKKPEEGIKLMLSMAMSVAEMAYEIDGELINVGEFLQ